MDETLEGTKSIIAYTAGRYGGPASPIRGSMGTSPGKSFRFYTFQTLGNQIFSTQQDQQFFPLSIYENTTTFKKVGKV